MERVFVTTVSMDRGVGGSTTNTNNVGTCHGRIRICLEIVFWKLFGDFSHAEKKFLKFFYLITVNSVSIQIKLVIKRYIM